MSAASQPSTNNSSAYGGRGVEILAVGWALLGITTILIIIRIYLQTSTAKVKSGVDGFWTLGWAILAWLLGTVGTSIMTVAVHYGFGNHNGTVAANNELSRALLYSWIWFAFSILTTAIAKFSIVALLLNIEGPRHKIQKWIMTAFVVSNLIFDIIEEFLNWFQCDRPSKVWRPNIAANCQLQTVQHRFALFAGSWGALVNLYLTLYFVYTIFQLRISMKWKVALNFLMTLGVLAAVCSCMATYEIQSMQASVDFTWDAASLVLWNMAETWILLIASSIPATLPLNNKHDPNDIFTHPRVHDNDGRDFPSSQFYESKTRRSTSISGGAILNNYHHHRQQKTTNSFCSKLFHLISSLPPFTHVVKPRQQSSQTQSSQASTLNGSIGGDGNGHRPLTPFCIKAGQISVTREVTVKREEMVQHPLQARIEPTGMRTWRSYDYDIR